MRKLASVRRIDEIKPIEGADAIECAVIGGWEVVVKKEEFQDGDLCVYFEIDSFVPNTLAPFLTKPGRLPRNYLGVDGERLKTIRLRGQLSQGLILPLDCIPSEPGDEGLPEDNYEEDQDVTEVLGVLKWEQNIPGALTGVARGNFPAFIRKTDQERIQNLSRNLEKWCEQKAEFEMTEKLDGSSMTVYYHEDRFGVCSRNWDLEETADNAFWQAARTYDLEKKLKEMCEAYGSSLALQGELIGPGIQKNPYGLNRIVFCMFDIFSIQHYQYFNPKMRQEFATSWSTFHVPWICNVKLETPWSVKDILNLAEYDLSMTSRKSILNKHLPPEFFTNPSHNVLAEGLVFKNVNNPDESFKAISNSWLLQNDG
jgi:RNA ligase (TIGR02306 family)